MQANERVSEQPANKLPKASQPAKLETRSTYFVYFSFVSYLFVFKFHKMKHHIRNRSQSLHNYFTSHCSSIESHLVAATGCWTVPSVYFFILSYPIIIIHSTFGKSTSNIQRHKYRQSSGAVLFLYRYLHYTALHCS